MQLRDEIIKFANAHLGEYKIKDKSTGGELIPTYCPLCNGGSSNDRNTFAISLDKGVYVCKRGSCGVHGRFTELAALFGEKVSGDKEIRPLLKTAEKEFDKPDILTFPATDKIYEYFESRKISRETVDAWKIQSDDSGMIVFPFYSDGELTYVKYRRPWKPNEQEKKMKEWQITNTKPVLYGMDMCEFKKPLIICEGEIDAMSLYEAGLRNVVSVPCGCDDTRWIQLCWDWLDRFSDIVVFGDNDAPGQKMVHEVVMRLGEMRCKVVDNYPEHDGKRLKDANEILYFCGPFELINMVDEAESIPVKGLLDLADVAPYDPTTIPRIKTNIPMLDICTGGLAEGGITVFTGKAGNGKLLADDTPVFTSAGWKTHGELVVGDEIVGEDGKFHKVTHVFPKDVANMCIYFSNGERIRCHENHEWVVDIPDGRKYVRKTVETKFLYHLMKDSKLWHGIKLIQTANHHDIVWVQSLGPCDPVPGNCIEVDGGIYLVGKTMIPTHNSTLGGQLLLNAVESGKSVVAYSGELSKERFQQWINLQAAGSDYISLKYDPVKCCDVPYVPYEVQERIMKWYRGKLFLFDNNEIFESNQAESIINVFTEAVRKYNVKLCLVDNLMTSLSDSEEETKAQGKFVNALKKFANKYRVHVVVVA